MAAEQDLELLVVTRAGDIGVGGHLEHGVGEVGRALLEVVEQPADEAVLQCFAIHRCSWLDAGRRRRA